MGGLGRIRPMGTTSSGSLHSTRKIGSLVLYLSIKCGHLGHIKTNYLDESLPAWEQTFLKKDRIWPAIQL